MNGFVQILISLLPVRSSSKHNYLAGKSTYIQSCPSKQSDRLAQAASGLKSDMSYATQIRLKDLSYQTHVPNRNESVILGMLNSVADATHSGAVWVLK